MPSILQKTQDLMNVFQNQNYCMYIFVQVRVLGDAEPELVFNGPEVKQTCCSTKFRPERINPPHSRRDNLDNQCARFMHTNPTVERKAKTTNAKSEQLQSTKEEQSTASAKSVGTHTTVQRTPVNEKKKHGAGKRNRKQKKKRQCTTEHENT